MFTTVFLIGLILYQIIGSLQSNDCDVLRVICRGDPQCVDETVFYEKCIESFVKNIPSQGISDGPVTWADKDNPDRPLYIDKRKLAYANIFNNYNTGSSIESEVKDYIHNTQTQNLQDLYADYQRESIRESLYLIKKKLHDQKTNTDVNEESGEARVDQNSAGINTNSNHANDNGELSQRKQIENTVKDVRASHVTAGNSAEGKQDVINKAFKLVQSLISEHDAQEGGNILLPIDSEKHFSEVKRKALTEEDTSQHSIVQGEATHKKSHAEVHEKSEELAGGEETQKSPADVHGKSVEIAQEEETHEKSHVKVHEKSVDHVEIGIPVYTRSEEDSDGETATDVVQGNDGKSLESEDRGLLTLNTTTGLSEGEAVKIAEVLSSLLWNISQHKVFHLQTVRNASATYQMNVGTSWFLFDDNAATVAKRINTDEHLQTQLEKEAGISVVGAISDSHKGYSTNTSNVKKVNKSWDKISLFSAIIAAAVLGLLFGAIVVCAVKRKGKSLTPLIFRRQEAVQDYQELCRTQMSVVNSPHPEDETDKTAAMKTWNDDQSPYNMDITTGHVILAYMEDHLKNENRLNKEWEALCNYKADENETLAGSDIKNLTKNRYRDVVPYEHTRVKLREAGNAFHSDYINASFITDTDPRNPSYIATQGPLDNTVSDFWQMVWEQGVVVIINLTKLSDMGLPQCHHYWPSDGSQVYHIFEVHLISEHIWCDDYLVRSLYLKNLQTAETRTVTQFHYLTWPDLSIPSSPKPLLEFRRKVNKCYRGHACPVIVHCNNGVGRTGTYILLDMVLNKMIKGTKEIDIAATLEHLRDQRQDFVKTKGQFEFALLAVAEEVTAILSAVTR